MNKRRAEDDSVDPISNFSISEQENTKKCRCGSTSHVRISHRDCPMNKGKTAGK